MKNNTSLSISSVLMNSIILGIAGSLFHMLYQITGENTLAALISPVNESIWEHLKIVFFPLLIWWIIMYLFKKDLWDISRSTWLTSAAVSLITAPLFVILLYYSYTGALGIHSLIADISLVFITSFLALSIAGHFLKYARPDKFTSALSIVIIIVIVAAFIYFTFFPPKLPLFLDSVTRTYGINK
ncbi:MAG: DUF6512 family protein [Oscillospiraceae bacterium]|nr:DUF6512 family protein [Oscillospiraceae bacterium]